MFLTALILAVVSSRRTIVHPLVSLCYSYIKCKNKLKYRTDTDTAFPYYDRQSGRVVFVFTPSVNHHVERVYLNSVVTRTY